jgi:hypothetical protein
VDGRWLAIDAIQADERIDFEIGKVEVDVDRIETNEEVDQRVLFLHWDVSEKSGFDLLAAWEGLIDGDRKREGLCIDISNINTAFMSKQDVIALAGGVYANVVFRIRRMRQEWLYDEVLQCSFGGFHLEKA